MQYQLKHQFRFIRFHPYFLEYYTISDNLHFIKTIYLLCYRYNNEFELN